MESYELFSCFCLFDECSLSKYKRESYKDLLERISPHEKKKSTGLLEYMAIALDMKKDMYVLLITQVE